MNYDNYIKARQRIMGPLFASAEYIRNKHVHQDLAVCDEGEQLYKEAVLAIEQAISSSGRLMSYIARMSDLMD